MGDHSARAGRNGGSQSRPSASADGRFGAGQTPFQDSAPPRRVLFDYDVPDEEGLHQEVTPDFGSLRVISLVLLSPLQERNAAHASKGDPIVLAFELARRCIGEITNSDDQHIHIPPGGELSERLWSQMHPKIRSLVVQGYSENAAPGGGTTASFLASRRIRA